CLSSLTYDDECAAGAVAGTDSPGAAGPARSIRGVVRRWMPRAGEPVADRRKGPRALSPVALSFFDGTSVVHGTRTVGSSTGVRSTADSVPRSRDSDRGRSRPLMPSAHGRGD